ncbi:hypothetical protein Pan44_16180 [Caulifigura coniformis]|uniref:Uncharacterized protein n=1 Tax=Caulifigura coniformis TaxID=2527983 RepID=A0A517SBX8_9PLAN|nr:hypothetical protein [Caulifigura coniformis]QDT53596.1 hypothetical protein Pan44_16180 [Caulifigura coniformis]
MLTMTQLAAALSPIFDRHSIPEAIRPDVVEFFATVEPMTPALVRFSRTKKWPSFLREARIEVGKVSRRLSFHGITEARARKYVTRQLADHPQRIEATITEAMRRSPECADLPAFYGLLCSVTIGAMRAEKNSRISA